MDAYYSISPQLYDDQFWWKKDDIEFWKKELSDDGIKVLELGCGTGRIASGLIDNKLHYIGMDVSSEYITYAAEKFKHFPNISFIQGNMIDFNLEHTFDYIFIGFNTFLHLLTSEEASNCLDCIKNHMHLKSNLIIDIFVPHPLFLHRPKNLKMHIVDFYNSVDKEEQSINEILKYNNATEIADVEWYYNNKQSTTMKFQFRMKMYYPDTMNRTLIDKKYRIVNLWGDYERNAFDEKSNLQIYTCKIA